jgi:signal transduction histidine kinase
MNKIFFSIVLVAVLATGISGIVLLYPTLLAHWPLIAVSVLCIFLAPGWVFFFRDRQQQTTIPLTAPKKISDEALEALEYKASLERIVNDISIALMEADSFAGFDIAVNKGLTRIGEVACVDRAYVLLIAEDLNAFTYSHEWCAPAIASQKETLNGLRIDAVPWLIRNLHDNDHVLLSGDTGYPDDVLSEQRIFGHQNNHAKIMVPIRDSGSLLGLIGFDFVAQPWIDEDIDLLRSLSNILGFAITRLRAAAQLVEREQRLIVYRDQLKSLMKELTLAEERERRKVAKDLHDQIGQMLAVVKIKQKKLAQSLIDEDNTSLSDEIIEMLDQILKDVRSLTFELSGLAVFRDDLNSAIDALGTKVLTERGVTFSFRTEGDSYEVPEYVRTILYQIVRELFYNTIKHAQAGHVDTLVHWSPEVLRIQVEDDGSGFVATDTRDLAQKDHFGLFNIRERVDSLGGYFEIQPSPGEGTTAAVSIPVHVLFAKNGAGTTSLTSSGPG